MYSSGHGQIDLSVSGALKILGKGAAPFCVGKAFVETAKFAKANGFDPSFDGSGRTAVDRKFSNEVSGCVPVVGPYLGELYKYIGG